MKINKEMQKAFQKEFEKGGWKGFEPFVPYTEIKGNTIKEFIEPIWRRNDKCDINDIDSNLNFLCDTYDWFPDDVNPIYDKFQDEIWEMIIDKAEEKGVSVIELMDRLLQYLKDNPDYIKIKNRLFWFAVEETIIKLKAEEV